MIAIYHLKSIFDVEAFQQVGLGLILTEIAPSVRYLPVAFNL